MAVLQAFSFPGGRDKAPLKSYKYREGCQDYGGYGREMQRVPKGILFLCADPFPYPGFMDRMKE